MATPVHNLLAFELKSPESTGIRWTRLDCIPEFRFSKRMEIWNWKPQAPLLFNEGAAAPLGPPPISKTFPVILHHVLGASAPLKWLKLILDVSELVGPHSQSYIAGLLRYIWPQLRYSGRGWTVLESWEKIANVLATFSTAKGWTIRLGETIFSQHKGKQ